MDDMRLQLNLFGHIKILELDAALGDSGVLSLIRLWSYVCTSPERRTEGSLAGMTDRAIELAARWAGAAGELVRTLLGLRLLDGDAEGNRVVHDWARWQPHAATSAARSAQSRAAAQQRWAQESQPPVDVTTVTPSDVTIVTTKKDWRNQAHIADRMRTAMALPSLLRKKRKERENTKRERKETRATERTTNPLPASPAPADTEAGMPSWDDLLAEAAAARQGPPRGAFARAFPGTWEPAQSTIDPSAPEVPSSADRRRGGRRDSSNATVASRQATQDRPEGTISAPAPESPEATVDAGGERLGPSAETVRSFAREISSPPPGSPEATVDPRGERPAPSPEALRSAIEAVEVAWQTRHPRVRAEGRDLEAIAARLADGWTVEELVLGVEGIHRDPWWGEPGRPSLFKTFEQGQRLSGFVVLARKPKPAPSASDPFVWPPTWPRTEGELLEARRVNGERARHHREQLERRGGGGGGGDNHANV